ncbi:SMC-Scp complex subunit ScpB [Anderseniella sp. Alg231-50]|uniref:SMC-Scp complex subunit ScpB n=1 Tax=Anderseniella sp. Alg231-50 TaxID=1922226 RepID=UPI003FCE34FF
MENGQEPSHDLEDEVTEAASTADDIGSVQDLPPVDDSDLPDYLLRKGDAISGVMPELQQQRVVEALLFAATGPLSEAELAAALPKDADVAALLEAVQESYQMRGVNLMQIAGKWAFRTADDLSFLLREEAVEQKKLSRAGLEVLSIIAYHQPVTRAEIEDIRGVATAKGTLDILMEIGWIKMRGRRRTPGRPVTYGTTQEFLEHFGLNEIRDLPGMVELKGAGLLSGNLPPDMFIPSPSDDDTLGPDEDPLDATDFEPELEMHLPDDEETDDASAEPDEALNMDLPEVLDDDGGGNGA